MSNINRQPSSPAEWEAYANDPALKNIPMTEDRKIDDVAKVATFRGIYLPASEVLLAGMNEVEVYGDVVSFTESEFNLDFTGTIEVLARVLTADAEVKINIPATVKSAALAIYTTKVDKPIKIISGNSQPVTLNLGPESGNAGVVIGFSADGTPAYEYQKTYFPNASEALRASFSTQLRIALFLFWRNTSVAISLCSYVASMTAREKVFSQLNTQAVALGQQLTGQVMAGENMSYAPVLPLEEYINAGRRSQSSALTFQAEYERYVDKEQEYQYRLKAWELMLQQARDDKSMYEKRRDVAKAKYESAQEIAARCQTQMESDQMEMSLRRIDFEVGLAIWEYNQQWKAVFNIIMAALSFAISIGELCLGIPNFDFTSIEKAIESIKELGEAGAEFAKTLQELADCLQALEDLYPKVGDMVDAVAATENDPNADIPSMDVISGTRLGDADSAAIATVGAWDKWALDADLQMDPAVNEEIDGAAEYRLSLQKHAVDGKVLAQAQAEAVKAGYEYVQAQMEVLQCQQHIEGLEEMVENIENILQGNDDTSYAQSISMFYDRLLAARTSVVIALRDAVWAYRYWTLTESSVDLDAGKEIYEYEEDINQIEDQLRQSDAMWTTDYQEFQYPVQSESLPLDFGTTMLDDIRGTHAGSFTLPPPKSKEDLFYGAFHCRMHSFYPTLRGARAKKNTVEVKLNISSSGIYADVREAKPDQILYFASLPRSIRCAYILDDQGVKTTTTVDPVFTSEGKHADPTAFTQWKVKLANPEDLDLSQLEGIDFEWTGRCRWDTSRRRRADSKLGA